MEHNFIENINTTCDMKGNTFEDYSEIDWYEYEKRCVISILDKKYRDLMLNNYSILENKNIKVYVKNIQNENNPKLYLFTYNNSIKIDSLQIYGMEKTSTPSTKNFYYYINKNWEVWILTVITVEEGTFFNNRKKYRLDSQTGKFELVDSMED
ncbi:hypothetical protein [Gilliamella intestini]|uniref:hypothetical protein n=1 Tax=Gilliamella intestini TaxID=1798183 RepID=UPI001428A4E9|nr:hypothetical protein [Gilliamella intestini]